MYGRADTKTSTTFPIGIWNAELLYVERGQVTVSLNNAAHSLEEGEAFFIDSREIHYIKGSASSITQIIMLTPDFWTRSIRDAGLSLPGSPPVLLIPVYYQKIRKELDSQKSYFDLKVRSLLSPADVGNLSERTSGRQGKKPGQYLYGKL